MEQALSFSPLNGSENGYPTSVAVEIYKQTVAVIICDGKYYISWINRGSGLSHYASVYPVVNNAIEGKEYKTMQEAIDAFTAAYESTRKDLVGGVGTNMERQTQESVHRLKSKLEDLSDCIEAFENDMDGLMGGNCDELNISKIITNMVSLEVSGGRELSGDLLKANESAAFTQTAMEYFKKCKDSFATAFNLIEKIGR